MTGNELAKRSKHLFPRNRILRHVLFWIFIYLLDVFVFGVGYEDVALFVRLAVLEMPGQLFFAYTVMYWVMPGYLRSRDHLKWGLVTLLAFIICGFIGQYLFLQFGVYTKPVAFFDLPKLFLRAFYSFLKACLAVLVKMGIMWYETEKKVTSLENARLETELKMLKDQVNPHFMFNTLNSLYGLMAKNVEIAQACVIKLSGILQFMLHESNFQTIPVYKELRCVRDYIDLEMIRYADKLQVSINIDDTVNRLRIAPLILFPLVENSVKHGVADNLSEAWINLNCSRDDKWFVFKLENSKAPLPKVNGYHGIGLPNVRRRLELLYPAQHSLQVIDSDNTFLVIVKIALTQMKEIDEQVYDAQMSDR